MANIKFSQKLDGYDVLDGDFTSDIYSLNGIQTASIQCVIETSDAYGEIALEKSNNASNWLRVYYIDQTDFTTVQDGYDLTGSACHPMFELDGISYGYLRLKYTRTSGTGGITWQVVTKKGR